MDITSLSITMGKVTCWKFTIHERHFQAQNGRILNVNIESQNNRIYMPNMALTRVAITSLSIMISRGKITKCTSPLWDGKKQNEVTSCEGPKHACPCSTLVEALS